jgi:ankyrin repeat protein
MSLQKLIVCSLLLLSGSSFAMAPKKTVVQNQKLHTLSAKPAETGSIRRLHQEKSSTDHFTCPNNAEQTKPALCANRLIQRRIGGLVVRSYDELITEIDIIQKELNTLPKTERKASKLHNLQETLINTALDLGRQFRDAAHKKNNELFKKLLLDLKINVTVLDVDNKTVLHHAVLGNNIEGVRLLLEDKDIDINAVDKAGRNILHYAVLNNNIEMVRLLLKNKDINVDAVDNNGQTPLFLAVSRKRDEIVDLLLTEGHANTEASDKNSFKPLHHAILQEDYTAFLSLIAHNANINSLGFEDKTPLDLINQLLSAHNEQDLEKHHPVLKQIKLVLNLYRAHTAEELQAQQKTISNTLTAECKETSAQKTNNFVNNNIPVYTVAQLLTLPESTEPTLPQTLSLESKETKPLHLVKTSVHS